MRQNDTSMGAFLRINGVMPSLKDDPVARHKKNSELVQECVKRYKLTIVSTPYRKKNNI
jgi:hypothetical protein